MRHISDPLEQRVAEVLEKNNFKFIHESENNGSSLDFHIPLYDVYIEVKKYHSDRISKQLAQKDNVIVLQGKKAVDLFILMLPL